MKISYKPLVERRQAEGDPLYIVINDDDIIIATFNSAYTLCIFWKAADHSAHDWKILKHRGKSLYEEIPEERVVT